MSDLRPEQDWFEKADQDLQMARGKPSKLAEQIAAAIAKS